MAQIRQFPIEDRKARIISTFERLGFEVVREGDHVSMVRVNDDGTQTPLMIPNQARIKGSTLRVICSKAGVSRDEFLRAYEQADLSAPVTPAAPNGDSDGETPEPSA